jgi:hypothetical protein
MAVIITDMDMPKNCNKCKNKNCHYFHQIWWDCDSDNDYSTIRHPRCPLKSVDEMIDEIKALSTWSRSLGSVTIPYHRVEEIIHKYCDKEE